MSGSAYIALNLPRPLLQNSCRSGRRNELGFRPETPEITGKQP